MAFPALLAHVVAKPDEDAPRLRYADVLEATGEADRAEFIRVSCSRKRGSVVRDPERWSRLFQREMELRRGRELAWSPGLTGAMVDPRSIVFERGFVASFTVTDADAFARVSASVLASSPLRSVTFACDLDAVGRFLGQPEAAQLRDVVIYAPDAGELVRALPRDGRVLASLERLTLARISATGDLLRVAAHRLPCLRTLMVDASPAGSARADVEVALEAIVDGPLGSQLDELLIADIPIGDEGALALARSRAARHLRALTLERCAITAVGANALAAGGPYARLVSLSLDRNPLGEEGTRALVGSARFVALRSLTLASAGATEATVRSFERGPMVAQLEHVSLEQRLDGPCHEADAHTHERR